MIPFLRRTDRARRQKTTPDKSPAAAISEQKSAVCNAILQGLPFRKLYCLQLQQIIRTCGIDVKTVVRKKYHVVYAKEGEQIGDLLSLMEAPKARMNFENIRILKDVRNSVNRKVNCEAANLNKTANASLEQVRDIKCFLYKSKVLS